MSYCMITVAVGAGSRYGANRNDGALVNALAPTVSTIDGPMHVRLNVWQRRGTNATTVVISTSKNTSKLTTSNLFMESMVCGAATIMQTIWKSYVSIVTQKKLLANGMKGSSNVTV